MLSVLILTTVLAAAPPEAPTVRLAVRPMAAPKPALRYQLLPEVRELQHGNPVQWYLRCFAEQQNFFFRKEVIAERTKYLTLPLAELPGETLRNYGGSALSQADYGARLDTPDWEVVDRIHAEGGDFRAPELAPLRVLAQGLRVRFRGEVARRDYAPAIRTAKTMFAFARHLGDYPAVEANRLGFAIAGLALDTLEEMLQQPDCPNLYWALTDLPAPLVDLRRGFQGDRTRSDAEFRLLRADAPMTDGQLEELVSHLSGRLNTTREQTGRPPRSLRNELKGRTARVGPARARLLEAAAGDGVMSKVAALRVMAYPDLQVTLLAAKTEFDEYRDDCLKRLPLAPWQLDGNDGDRAAPLFADFLPEVAESRREQARIEQRVGLLRHIEALRLYAAGHNGKVPDTLDAVGVPLPTDPFTGKAFGYSVENGIAVLRCESKNPAFAVRYEITLRN